MKVYLHQKFCRNNLVIFLQEQTLNIFVGMKSGQKITFSGEGDQQPGLEHGDVIMVLREKADSCAFERRGDDLVAKMEISLSEALTGFRRVIRTLDERDILITSGPGALMVDLCVF